MKIYNTYAECKLANPDCEVYTTNFGSGWIFATKGDMSSVTNNYHLATHVDHLMTVEEFLADSNKFVDGDVYLDKSERVNIVGVDTDKECSNFRCNYDSNRFVLKAAALENKQDDPNKHPHHDLIVEWAKDTSKKLQIKTLADDVDWQDCSMLTVIENPKFLVRFKPQREFIKGHWYPCVDADGDFSVKYFDGYIFSCYVGLNSGLESHEMKWIGDSLGEIKFGEEVK